MDRWKFATCMALMALTGCAQFTPKPVVREAPLAEVLGHIRTELIKAQAQTSATQLPLTEVVLILKVSTSNKYSSAQGTSLPFDPALDLKFTTETSGSLENTVQLKWTGTDGRNTLGVQKPTQ